MIPIRLLTSSLNNLTFNAPHRVLYNNSVFLTKINFRLFSSNITHNPNVNIDASFELSYQKIRKKILSRGDVGNITVNCQLEILNQLMEFPLGRFLIVNGGLNGYWTDYIISGYLKQAKQSHVFNPIEDFLLNQALSVRATRERFDIFKLETQKLLCSKMSICSIPCGLMSDLLDLDYSHLENVMLTGIDIDPVALQLAQKTADKRKDVSVYLFKKNAWEIEFQNNFNLILSNGLNIYESNREKRLYLYKIFFNALIEKGNLITSFMTKPPDAANISEWKLEKMHFEHLQKEKIILQYILDTRWMNFQSSEEMKKDLKLVGFKDIKLIYDSYHIFPTIIAKK